MADADMRHPVRSSTVCTVWHFCGSCSVHVHAARRCAWARHSTR